MWSGSFICWILSSRVFIEINEGSIQFSSAYGRLVVRLGPMERPVAPYTCGQIIHSWTDFRTFLCSRNSVEVGLRSKQLEWTRETKTALCIHSITVLVCCIRLSDNERYRNHGDTVKLRIDISKSLYPWQTVRFCSGQFWPPLTEGAQSFQGSVPS